MIVKTSQPKEEPKKNQTGSLLEFVALALINRRNAISDQDDSDDEDIDIWN